MRGRSHRPPLLVAPIRWIPAHRLLALARNHNRRCTGRKFEASPFIMEFVMPRAYAQSRAIARARALAADLIAQLDEVATFGVDDLDIEFDPTPLPEPDIDLAVLSYQYRENYSFDANGHLIEDGGYWKSKGGDEVVVRIPDGWTIENVRDSLRARFEWDNPASYQYFLGAYRASCAEVNENEYLVECGYWVPTSALTVEA